MKKIFYLTILLSCHLAILPACGGDSSSGNQAVNPTGPDLDIAELSTISIDQLKFFGGLEDDQDGVPEPSIYLRCYDNNTDILCAGVDDGLSIVKKNGMSYARLNVKFKNVEGIEDASCFDLKVLFIEKDSDACPAKIAEDDDVLWESKTLSISDTGDGLLLNTKIASDDGNQMIYLIGPADPLSEELLAVMPAKEEAVLTIDQLYFKSPDVSNGNATLKVVVKKKDGSGFRCESSAFNAAGAGIDRNGIIYGGLNIELLDEAQNKCAVNDANKLESVVVSVHVTVGNDTTTLLTEDATAVGDLVNNDNDKEFFADDKGYISFQPIAGF